VGVAEWYVLDHDSLYFTQYFYKSPGGSTIQNWGINFGLCVGQEVLGSELLRIYFEFVVGARSVRPQIMRIYNTFSKVARKLSTTGPTEEEDLRLCQHVSGSCRTAHFPEFKDLVSAKILRELDDHDISNCQRLKKRRTFSILAFLFVGIPAFLSVVIPDSGNIFGNVVCSGIVSGFLLVNNFLYSISISVLVLAYAGTFGLLIYTLCVYIPARNRVHGVDDENEDPDDMRSSTVNNFSKAFAPPTFLDYLVYNLSPTGFIEFLASNRCLGDFSEDEIDEETLSRIRLRFSEEDVINNRESGDTSINISNINGDIEVLNHQEEQKI
jgi:hypothetical protein